MKEQRTQFEIEETLKNEEHSKAEECSSTEENNQRYN